MLLGRDNVTNCCAPPPGSIVGKEIKESHGKSMPHGWIDEHHLTCTPWWSHQQLSWHWDKEEGVDQCLRGSVNVVPEKCPTEVSATFMITAVTAHYKLCGAICIFHIQIVTWKTSSVVKQLDLMMPVEPSQVRSASSSYYPWMKADDAALQYHENCFNNESTHEWLRIKAFASSQIWAREGESYFWLANSTGITALQMGISRMVDIASSGIFTAYFNAGCWEAHILLPWGGNLALMTAFNKIELRYFALLWKKQFTMLTWDKRQNKTILLLIWATRLLLEGMVQMGISLCGLSFDNPRNE